MPGVGGATEKGIYLAWLDLESDALPLHHEVPLAWLDLEKSF